MTKMMKLGLMIPKEDMPSAKENKEVMERLAEYWHLGPEVGSDKPGANKEYWAELAKVWGVEDSKARRRLCANCEYFDDSPKMLKAMEQIPYNKFDETGGGRGFCRKFDFICHNLRTCQAWEKQPTCMDEEEDY